MARISQESNGQVTRDFLYDGLARPMQLDTALDGKRYTEQWTFDPFGRPFQHLFKASDVSGETGERNVYSDGSSGITAGYLSQVRSAYPLSDGRFPVYRQIESMNARGQVEKELGAAGSEYTQEREFEPATGRLKRLLAQSSTVGILQDLRYTYDKIGNVTSRTDNNGGRLVVETFTYDSLQRLLTASVGDGLQTSYVRSQTYDLQGSIQTKSDVGTYTYGSRPAACSGNPPPYAVAAAGTTSALCYDANGNMVKRVTPQGTQTIAYTAADQASDIRDQRNRVGFQYGPNRERLRRLDYAGAGATSALSVVHYVGGAEIRYAATTGNGAGAMQEVRRYAGNVLVVQTASGASYGLKRQILLTDAQGSTHQVLGAMTLQPVNGASPASFDAWGLRRDATTWGNPVPWDIGLETSLRSSTTHGYTGHEMVESVGVIHMNGRLYEPTLARFLQSDPFVQSPQDSQSWNRYTYAFNNPLAYTDPSGNMSASDFLRTAAAIVITVYTGGAAAGSWGFLGMSAQAAAANGLAIVAVGGFTAGAIQTGSLKGAVTSAVSAGVFYGIGNAFSYGNAPGLYESKTTMTFSGYAAKTLSHGIAGGVMAELQGGRFGHGFASAGFSEALSPAVGRIESTPVQAIAVAIVGGTASSLAGGKFANGAVTAAFSYAFGAVASRAAQNRAMDQRMAAAAAFDYDSALAFEWPSLPQNFVDSAAGMGDSLTLGATRGVRELLGIDGVNVGSTDYSIGYYGAMVPGAGRMMYSAGAEGIAATGSLIGGQAGAQFASSGRNFLRIMFRGFTSGYGSYPFSATAAKYGNDWGAVISAAGRTNQMYNEMGVMVGGASAAQQAATCIAPGC